MREYVPALRALLAELLQSHAGLLAAAATSRDVARTTIARLEAAGTSAAWVQLVRGRTLELLESVGVPEENLARYARYGVEAATPPAEAARTGAIVEATTGEEVDARFPESAVGPGQPVGVGRKLAR